jgi:hypothetical protein
MKTMRWVGLRNCVEKQKVKIIVVIPITERVEAERSTMVKVRICSWVRPIAIAIVCHIGGGNLIDSLRFSTGVSTCNAMKPNKCLREMMQKFYLLIMQGVGRSR